MSSSVIYQHLLCARDCSKLFTINSSFVTTVLQVSAVIILILQMRKLSPEELSPALDYIAVSIILFGWSVLFSSLLYSQCLEHYQAHRRSYCAAHILVVQYRQQKKRVKYTCILKGTNEKAKANAAQGLPELIITATNMEHTDNSKAKHKKRNE